MRHYRTIRTIVIVVTLCLTLFTGLRLGWLHLFEEEPFPEVKDGSLDMSQASFSNNELYLLSGEWQFFPGERITPDQIPDEGQTHEVPGPWAHSAVNEGVNLLGEATYRVTITLPEDIDTDLGLRFYEINTAAEIYANGELIHTVNSLDHDKDERGMDYGPVDISFHPGNTGELDLIVIVTNHTLSPRGGLQRDVLFGASETITNVSMLSKGLQLAAGLILLLHAVYAIILYILPREQKNNLLLLFGLMLLMFASGVFLDDEVLISLPVSLPLSLKILLTVFILTLYVMTLIVSATVKLPKIVFGALSAFFITYAAVALIFPIEQYTLFTRVTMLMIPVFILVMITLTIRAILHGNRYAYFILAFLLAYSSNVIWGTLIKLNVVQFPFYLADFIFSMMALMGLVLLQHTDITKENRRQAELIIQNEASKDQFLANTAHELRNPLHGILTITNTMLEQLESKPKEAIRHDLELNRKIGNQMKFILDDLKDFTLLKESRIRLMPEEVDVTATAGTIADILAYQIPSDKVRIKVDTEPCLPKAFADHERFFQVLYNLLHNAVKFTEEGVITISIRHNEEEDKLHISITDTGIGIPAAELDRLMKPYEQGGERQMGGIGLGLNISRELTRLHGGTFEILSEEGIGTDIHLYWPVAEGTERSDSDTPPSATILRSQTVPSSWQSGSELPHLLIVDDDPLNLDLIGNALGNDYAISTAASGDEALSLLDAHYFDLVISDVMMPGMSGYALTEQIRQRYDLVHMPVLLLTARYHTADIITGFEAGANDYVSKPVEISELKTRVKTLTDMKHAAFKRTETEAALLQSQIRPHFLYNTLNAIASLSQTDPDRMTDLLFEFGEYLKHSFQVPEMPGLVTLEEELHLIRAYLFIEQTRFEDRLHVTVDVSDAHQIHVPRLAIQTLVENAINHGALKTKGTGRVTLHAHRDAEGAVITVSDNGPGQADMLRRKLDARYENGTGIGLPNAHERVRQVNQEGLLIHNHTDGGIVITIRLP